MASGKLTDWIANGTHSARPATPNVGSNGISIYYETDTGNTFVYSTTAGWVQVNGSTSLGTSTGIPVSFNPSATGTNWNPQGHTSSSYFKGTASITPPARPYTLRVRALVQQDASSSDSYYGIALSSDGTNFIASDISPVGSGFCEAYYGTISAAPAGAYFSPFQLGANQLGFIELDVLVSTSAIVNVAAQINKSPIFSGGSTSNRGAFEATTVDLTTGFFFYALGAHASNVIACEYKFALF